MKNVITSYRRIRRPIILAIIIALNVLLLVTFYLIANNSDENEYVYSDHIKLDTVSAAPDPAVLYARVANEMPSLPLEQLLKFPNLGFALNESCAPYPDIYDIKYFNNYWQTFDLPDATIRLFGAYYDKRKAVPEAPLVRILTMINGSEYTSNTTYCQIWFHGQNKPAIVPATDFSMIWYKDWGNSAKHVYPHLISCKIPDLSAKYIPQTVSLVRDPCQRATNNLKVYYEPPDEGEPQQFGFAVCVKAIDFKFVDMSARLIEWIEVQRQLGARLITIHNYQLHPNVTRVLEYYHSTGFVDFRPFAFARGEPNIGEFAHIAGDVDNHNRILHEVIPYNDCFYRNMYKYEFISVQDIDEVIMPLGNLTDWHKLFDVVRGWPSENCNIRRYSSYCFRNVYFPRYPEKKRIFEDLPEYFYMLQHVERVREHLDPNLATKCFHSTAYCTKLHNHFPMGFVDSCYPLSVNATTAQMEHYREPDIKETLNDPVFDDNMWRFKNEIVNRSTSVLEKLGFLEKIKKSEFIKSHRLRRIS